MRIMLCYVCIYINSIIDYKYQDPYLNDFTCTDQFG